MPPASARSEMAIAPERLEAHGDTPTATIVVSLAPHSITAVVTRVARKIFEAHRARETFEPLRGPDAPASLEEAYLIQDEVDRLFVEEAGAGPIGGHKIALTSRAVQELCGVDQPAYGRVFASTIRQSPATVKLADFIGLGLEFEVGVEIASDVPASGAPYDRKTIAEYVASCMPAFELVEDRGADYSDLDAASILTDRCWCGGVVLGAAVEDWQHLDLAACPAELTWNGEAVDRDVTGASMGHPFEGLAWVANHLAPHEGGLRAGEIVITGSALATRHPEAGDEVVYRIDGLGETKLVLE